MTAIPPVLGARIARWLLPVFLAAFAIGLIAMTVALYLKGQPIAWLVPTKVALGLALISAGVSIGVFGHDTRRTYGLSRGSTPARRIAVFVLIVGFALCVPGFVLLGCAQSVACVSLPNVLVAAQVSGIASAGAALIVFMR